MTTDEILYARFSLQRSNFHLDAELSIPNHGVTGVFGHSGSGKTTLLRCLAGLERSDRGQLRVDGIHWQDGSKGLFMPAYQRPIGMVFQEARLFPHLTVLENIRYGIKRKRTESKPVDLDHVIEVLAIEHLLNRKPDKLSGGEQQRGAIARALLTGPKLLLMDEPLSALDGACKAEFMPFLQRLHNELLTPIIYVTHSLGEITQLADHLVLMENGKTIASSPLDTMLARLDLPLAREEDAVTVINGVVSGIDRQYGLAQVETAIGILYVEAQGLSDHSQLKVHIHARDVSLSLKQPESSSTLNIVEARISEIAECTPTQVNVMLMADDTPLLSRVTRLSCDRLDLQPGMKVYAQIKSISLKRSF